MDEITTNINVSGIPVEWIPEINKVSNNFSKAVRTLIKEALEARKTKESNALREGIEVVRRKFSPQPIPQKATKHSNL